MSPNLSGYPIDRGYLQAHALRKQSKRWAKASSAPRSLRFRELKHRARRSGV